MSGEKIMNFGWDLAASISWIFNIYMIFWICCILWRLLLDILRSPAISVPEKIKSKLTDDWVKRNKKIVKRVYFIVTIPYLILIIISVVSFVMGAVLVKFYGL